VKSWIAEKWMLRFVCRESRNIWTQPIINRIEMLATGIRSQVGIKIFGNDLDTLEKTSREIADAIRDVPGAADVYPEQIGGAPYIDIDINRQAAAKYGIEVGTIQDIVEKGSARPTLRLPSKAAADFRFASATLRSSGRQRTTSQGSR